MRTETDAEKKLDSRLRFKFNFQSYALILALILIAILFGALTQGEFLSARNLSNLFTQMTVISVLAIGMTFVIVAAHIDLSVGSLAGLTGGIAAILHVWFDLNTGIVVLIAILVGALLGLWQGWWVAYRAVPAFIVTLGGMLIFRGILIGISKGQTISPLDDSFKMISNSYLPYYIGYSLAAIGIFLIFIFRWINRNKRKKMGLKLSPSVLDYGKLVAYAIGILVITYMLNRYYGIPVPLLIVIALAGIFIFISSKTSFGRNIYAIGGNEES